MAGFIFLAQIFLYLPKLYWPFFVTVTYTDYDSHGSFHVTHTKYSYIKNTVIHDNIFNFFTTIEIFYIMKIYKQSAYFIANLGGGVLSCFYNYLQMFI